MVTSTDCLKKWGSPKETQNQGKYLKSWDVPEYINKAIPELPNRIYCTEGMAFALEVAFYNIIDRKLTHLVKTYDGVFNIRKKRGARSWSLHSWGVAIDINAAWNQFGAEPQMSRELVRCFTDAGFDWGGTWKKKDGMHFQLKWL